jgi:UDP-N-acetylmuramyl tripeptide synthase
MFAQTRTTVGVLCSRNRVSHLVPPFHAASGRVRVIAERSATAAALTTATSGDLVPAAGHGDEPYQLLGQQRIPSSGEATDDLPCHEVKSQPRD